MRNLCFTVDLDRDANIAVPGSRAAGSLDRGMGTAPRFVSSFEGSLRLAEMLDDLGMKATFFAEARTLEATGVAGSLQGHEIALHGLDHEDFSGSSGYIFHEGEVESIISEAISIIRDIVGSSPKGFRAPYMLPTDDQLAILPRYGIVYDSSTYTEGTHIEPEVLSNGLMEIPALQADDGRGKRITSYLWSMHERKRGPQDFIDLGRSMESGTFVLATHTWHIVESRRDGRLGNEFADCNISDVSSIISALMDDGFVPHTMYEVYEETVPFIGQRNIRRDG